jgi:hypothetical protein
MYTYQNFYIPERMMSGLENWVLYGIKPGSFLTAVLENNMVNAVGNADIENLQNLRAYAIYCYNELPSPCWGSKEKVNAWEATKLAEREAEAKQKATTSVNDTLTT